MHSLRAFAICYYILKHGLILYTDSKKSWSDGTDAQTDLSHRCPQDTF